MCGPSGRADQKVCVPTEKPGAFADCADFSHPFCELAHSPELLATPGRPVRLDNRCIQASESPARCILARYFLAAVAIPRKIQRVAAPAQHHVGATGASRRAGGRMDTAVDPLVIGDCCDTTSRTRMRGSPPVISVPANGVSKYAGRKRCPTNVVPPIVRIARRPCVCL